VRYWPRGDGSCRWILVSVSIIALIIPMFVAVVAVSSTAEAQSSGRLALVGVLHPGSQPLGLLEAFRDGLRELGYKDIDLPKLRANAAALSKVAHLAKLPTFTAASVPDGPNGPLISEIHGNNPDAVYIPRTGQINAWDNLKWVEAIEKTGARPSSSLAR
jgi:hypothetical protein